MFAENQVRALLTGGEHHDEAALGRARVLRALRDADGFDGSHTPSMFAHIVAGAVRRDSADARAMAHDGPRPVLGATVRGGA